MTKFIQLTSISYKNGIEVESLAEETPVCINVSHISYFFPEGDKCKLVLDDQSAMTQYKDNYTAHSSKFTVKESFDEVCTMLQEYL